MHQKLETSEGCILAYKYINPYPANIFVMNILNSNIPMNIFTMEAQKA